MRRQIPPAEGDEEETREGLRPRARALADGDLYAGDFHRSDPRGGGGYIWADGRVCSGEWRRGRFSWPSGATFEGRFRSGRMQGSGTFTGPGGDTHRGAWVDDRRHGYGPKRYSNGDFYEGTWRRNLQDGHGRYIWRNGNQYVGEWRGGVICGRGVLIWANGNRYDGFWENGVPRGNGVFTWPDGSCYIGDWSERALTGTFYPAVGAAKGGRRPPPPPPPPSAAEKGFPKICIWESDGEAGDITCDIIDTLEVYRDGKLLSLGEAEGVWRERRRRSPCCFRGGEAKKPGQMISKGHKNYDLMLNLQLGIRYSVGKPASTQMRELRAEDFDPREKYWTRFPPEGSKVTPPHQSAEFRWKDYCPMVFRHLRKLFKVDPADYMMAICGNDALRELSSPGKSGSFFYLTQDDRFMIKTVKKSEVKVLIRMLSSYYQHVCQYENSLVTKFFGVHCVKPIGGQKVRFIVIGNVFCSEHRIHRRFDLKGSSHGRTTDKAEEEIDETTTLKDLDLDFLFWLQKSWFIELLRQIDRDCEFLEAEGIMDYSLLVGLHFRDDISASKMGLSSPRFSGKRDSCQVRGVMSDFRFSESGWNDAEQILDFRKPTIRLGANMHARAEYVSRNSNFDAYPMVGSGGGLLMPAQGGEIYDVVLYFGIIDILQDYDISKKLEHAYKSLQADPTSISAVDPKLYSRRFRDFIRKIFVEDND